MFTSTIPLLLASASPRRHDLLCQVGLKFTIKPAQIDETPVPGERPVQFAERMASTKALVLARSHADQTILAADTIVCLPDRIFGKPQDEQEALQTLLALQGKSHQVITGYAIINRAQNIEHCAHEVSHVHFTTWDKATLWAYVQSGDPMDKAGSYGIQQKGAFLVQSIGGSYTNIVGLPLSQVLNALVQYRLIEPVH